MNIGVTEISPRAVQRAAEKNFKSGYYCCEALMCTIRDEFKLDVPRSTEGSGLGLSIAQSLTEMQGGTFELYLDGDLFKVTIKFPVS